jgi:exopolysaccharide biosynthesis protein
MNEKYVKASLNERTRQCHLNIPAMFWEVVPQHGYFIVSKDEATGGILYVPSEEPPVEKKTYVFPKVEKKTKKSNSKTKSASDEVLNSTNSVLQQAEIEESHEYLEEARKAENVSSFPVLTEEDQEAANHLFEE